MKRARCFNCGEDLGEVAWSDPFDTCGAAECNREARWAEQDERERAHEQLDEDRGWL